MYRLLLLITSLLIIFSGSAQTSSDSLKAVRKAQVEKARAEARAKAEARAAERTKNEVAKQNAENVTDKKNSDSKTVSEADKNIKEEKSKRERRSRDEKADNAKDSKKSDVKTESKVDAKADKNVKEESKREKKSRKEKADNSNDSKKAAADKDATKKEKEKKPSARERNKADTTIAKSKYGPGTFGLRGNIGASIAWNDYSDREHKIGFNSWGFVLSGGMGYRFNHIGYVGVLIDVEAIELLAFSPMLDFVVSAPTPVSPFIELTAGPYVSYDEYRKWVFQPRAGLSYRGKKNKIMRFGFGLRMYDDAFDSDSFSPQYAASYSVEF